MQAFRSQYLRTEPTNLIVRRYVARALLSTKLERALRYGSIDERALALFPDGGLDADEAENPKTVRRWLRTELPAVADATWDEDDPFVRNTAALGAVLELDDVELEIMRFALLLQNVKALDTVSDLCNDSLGSAEAVGLVAVYTGIDEVAVAHAFGRDSRLRGAGFFAAGRRLQSDLVSWVTVPQGLRSVVFERHEDESRIVEALFERCREPSLEIADFEHLGTRLTLLREYLARSLAGDGRGANVLLWGPPGTGKTELSRLLVRELDALGVEVASEDEDGDPLNAFGRVCQYRLCQAMLARRTRALVVYDEVEDVISDSGFASFGLHERAPLTKGMTNRMLETNASPSIWITNTNVGIDPAYLRRFDVVVKVDGPLEGARRRLADETLGPLGLEPVLLDALVARRELSPAHLQRFARVCAGLEVAAGEAASSMVRDLAGSDLEALDAAPLPASNGDADPDAGWRLPYDARMINADMDLATLAERLGPGSRARLLLSGPPGTGKTAWARHLAQRTGRTLAVKRASDIRGRYVGDTEGAIERAFREAEDEGAVLLFDEVDSFVQDRAGAQSHHEVSFVNQFLTSLETYRGLFVATTNLPDALDPATTRRFDFKVRLDTLAPEQVRRLVVSLAGALGSAVDEIELARAMRALAGLSVTPGDAEVVLRRCRVMGDSPGAEGLAEALAAECAHRGGREARPIGFLATGS